MTDEQIIKALECCADHDNIDACDDCPCLKGKCISTTPYILDLINRQKAEIDDLFCKLTGVMHSVDKWLSVEELKQDEVSRAITMREKTLQIVEKQKAEIEELKKILESRHRVIDSLEDSIIGLPDQIRAEVVKEFAERLKADIVETGDVHGLGNRYPVLTYNYIDNLVKEMVGEER